MSTPCDHLIVCPGYDEDIGTERYNRPGLSAISYRLGTHGEFFQRMLDSLHTNEVLCRQLTTRSRDDFAIALLDAWAMIGDVLAFYQERIANEGYLRTATERRSILEMARTIGYELNPGVAASTYLAFIVDETDPKYARVKVPQGTQVQSLPSQGKLPQTFETSEEFEARVEWNELKPRTLRRQTLAIEDGELVFLSLCDEQSEGSPKKFSEFCLVNNDSSLLGDDYVVGSAVHQLYLKGTANNLNPGDLLLFIGERNEGERETVVKVIHSTKVDKEQNRTVIYLDEGKSTLPSIFNRTTNPVASIPTGLDFDADIISSKILKTDISEETLDGLINVNKWSKPDLVEHVKSIQAAEISPDGVRGVYALRERVGFFGNNAPDWRSLPLSQRVGEYYVLYHDEYKQLTGEPSYVEPWDPDGWEIWRPYPDNGIYYSDSADYGADIYLERKVDGIGGGSWAVFECASVEGRYRCYQIQGTIDRSIAAFSLSGKATGLMLSDPNGGEPVKLEGLKVRTTSVHIKSELLELSELPIEDGLEESAGKGVYRMMLDGLVLGLSIGQPLIVNGERADAEGILCHEVAIVKDITHSRGYTILYFKDPLRYVYLRNTVTVNANVVPATHGETVNEVLGSGDGTQSNQSFVLKKPPLTYVSATTPSGAASTLRVNVDGLEWKQVLSLFTLGPDSRSYTVRLDDDGDVNVIFGDGKRGARLPAGQENVKATYRSGIGADGEVPAGSIRLLKTRPLGIRGTSNPIASSGSQEPEDMDNARTNAPRTVLTMERIVSLQDYEDFVRTYAGIGKAQVVVLGNGKTELVHITVADSYGEPIDSDGELFGKLAKSVDSYRDRLAVVQIDTFERRLFHVEAKLLIDEKYTAGDVLTEADSTLEEAFSFWKRKFGRPVSAAEVISKLQDVPGVIAVDLDKLYLSDPLYEIDPVLGPLQSEPAAVLPCSKAEWPEGGNFRKAQLLLINPSGIKLEERKS